MSDSVAGKRARGKKRGRVIRAVHDAKRTGETAIRVRLHLPSLSDPLGDEALLSLRTAGPKGRDGLRRIVEAGLPVEAVKELQEELKRFGVPRPSNYVESIASRAARARRDTLTLEEGERLVRIAAILARALDVWEDREDAAEFLTTAHPELDGDSPIDRARSEIGARQVEDLLLRLDLGVPV